MWKYKFFSIVVFILTTQLLLIECQCPLSTEREKNLYKKLCYEPSGFASKLFTFDTFNRDSPPGGWFVVLGNDAVLNHFGTAVKGEELRSNDSYDDMCYTIDKTESYSGRTQSGAFHGFGKKQAAIWNCSASLDFPGVNRCHVRNALSSKYRSNLHFYYLDTEIDNVYVALICFSNGDTGWLTMSTEKTFFKETIENQMRTLGFPTTNIVNMYNENCKVNYKK